MPRVGQTRVAKSLARLLGFNLAYSPAVQALLQDLVNWKGGCPPPGPIRVCAIVPSTEAAKRFAVQMAHLPAIELEYSVERESVMLKLRFTRFVRGKAVDYITQGLADSDLPRGAEWVEETSYLLGGEFGRILHVAVYEDLGGSEFH